MPVKYLNKTAVILFLAIMLSLFRSAGAESRDQIVLRIDTAETISKIAADNGLPVEKLLKGFKLNQNQSQMTLAEAGIQLDQAQKIIRRLKVLQATENAKNWKQIVSKFGLWILVLTAATLLLIRKKVTTRMRIFWLAGSTLLFGFVYGSDPNPMGTVKDAIVLLGKEGVVFPPRLIAAAVFLLMVFISNKAICGWGCHFGALQDLLHFVQFKKFKLPFWITNGIRLAVFLSIVLLAFAWGLDWVGEIDPFKLFNVSNWVLGLAGLIFTAAIMLLSLFFYRPWCQLFCPFGLAGWLAEQVSLLRPRIDRKGCLKCQKCVKVCPTQAMDGIYHDRKFRADCFACGECIGQCPAQVINWKLKTSDKELK